MRPLIQLNRLFHGCNNASVDEGISRLRFDSQHSFSLFHDRDLWRFLGFPLFFPGSRWWRGPIVSYNPHRDRTCEAEGRTDAKGRNRETGERRKGRTQSGGWRMWQERWRERERYGRCSVAVIIRPLWSTQWTVGAQFRVKYGSINGEPL